MSKENINNKISTIIIGLGGIGFDYDLNNKNVLTHFKSINKNRNFVLSGVVDIDKNKLIKIKKKFPNLNCFEDYNYAIKTLSPKMVVISTPTTTHLKIIKKVAKYNCIKYFFIEKPCGENFNQYLKIKNVLKENKKFFYVNLFRSYLINYVKLFNQLKKAKFLDININYNRGFRNNCSHIFSLMSLIKTLPIKINILSYNLKKNIDNLNVELIYKKNCKVKFYSNYEKKNSTFNIDIKSDLGRWISDNSLNNFYYYNLIKDKEIKGYYKYSDLKKNLKFDTKHIQASVLEKLYKLIIKKKNNLIKNYDNTFKTLDLIERKIKN